eukprot:TRINITY_DN19819_c0_g1_i1.p1 TRINITY_DN19819_c0_g1~~TRINITY_DN19819_c0_g1_i1.p1  ORF type:complete len:444 (-),score=101.14 TRINITY_DN19819_c0_g1_i1:25-1215(-)
MMGGLVGGGERFNLEGNSLNRVNVDGLRLVKGANKDDFNRLIGEEVNWWNPQEIISQFYNNQVLISPQLYHVALQLADHRGDDDQSIVKILQDLSLKPQDRIFPSYYSPGIQILPIESHTLPPFNHTNLIVIPGANQSLFLVDPAPHQLSLPSFTRLLQTLQPLSIQIFITHHHADHFSPDVLDFLSSQPYSASIQLYTHSNNINSSRINHGSFPLHSVPHNHLFKIQSSDPRVKNELEIQVLDTPGHTDGHMCLYERQSKVLIAGDHVVGVGSSVLSAPDGGNMKQYLETCRELLKLEARMMVPAHGPLVWNVGKLLREYIIHRTERERQIEAAIREGAKTMGEVVEVVYKGINDSLKPVAAYNVSLHVEKLKEDGKLPKDFNFEQEKVQVKSPL